MLERLSSLNTAFITLPLPVRSIYWIMKYSKEKSKRCMRVEWIHKPKDLGYEKKYKPRKTKIKMKVTN